MRLGDGARRGDADDGRRAPRRPRERERELPETTGGRQRRHRPRPRAGAASRREPEAYD